MSMLAEPRSKQKWSEDPRNIRWASDKSKFGYQMLTRMGWSEGKGLGHKENGEVSHIKVNKRRSNAGIGAKKSHDDDWISHQDDFNALLNKLNQGNGSDATSKTITSLEHNVKKSRTKILYSKFVKSKDLSNASSQDLACIFGQRSKSAPATPQLSDEEGNDTDTSAASCPVIENGETEKKHGIVTINSGLSVADYFAKKMADLKSKQAINSNESVNDTQDGEKIADKSESIKTKKKNKRKYEITVEEQEVDNTLDDSTKVKKKKKKSKKNRDEEIEIIDNNKMEESINKKKQKNKQTDDTENLDDVKSSSNENEPIEILKKKKKKKRKNIEVVKNEILTSDSEEISEESQKQSDEEVIIIEVIPSSSDTDEGVKELKKKKKKKKKKKIAEDL